MSASGPSCAADLRCSAGSRPTRRCTCAPTRMRTTTRRCRAASPAGARSRRYRCTRVTWAQTSRGCVRRIQPVQFLGRVSWTLEETGALLFRVPGWWQVAIRVFGNYLLDFPQRLYSSRDRRLTLGNALLGRLKLSANKFGAQLWLNAPLVELIRTDGRVTGAVIERDGRRIRVGRVAGWCSPPVASSAMRRCAASTCRARTSRAGAARRRTTPAMRSSRPWTSGPARSTWTRPGGAPR